VGTPSDNRQIYIFGAHSYGKPAGYVLKGGAYAIVAERRGVQHEHWGLGFEVNAPALVAHALVRLINFVEAELDLSEVAIPRIEIVTSCATTIAMRINGALRDKAKIDRNAMSGRNPKIKIKDSADLWLELAHRFDLFSFGDYNAALSHGLFTRSRAIARSRAAEAAKVGSAVPGIRETDTSPLDWVLDDAR
jgi:hypothetical protein